MRGWGDKGMGRQGDKGTRGWGRVLIFTFDMQTFNMQTFITDD